ncbi:hypothetical protein AVEN_137533-1 [Araneus ventricosus]|uniref:DUF4817 domain-containing protein n=1 Tax=Araneus ventricosus TaxID=182803 RepID=A0A4Y2JPC2_ARAVE|nr:hypothetical protein AVEN_137533-1 [Araneus ventricosus]
MTRYIHSPSLCTPNANKMPAMQEKSFCVLEYAKCSSVTSVERAFLRKYEKAAPGHLSILCWFRQFRETGLDDVPLLPWPPCRQISCHAISSCGVM